MCDRHSFFPRKSDRLQCERACHLNTMQTIVLQTVELTILFAENHRNCNCRDTNWNPSPAIRQTQTANCILITIHCSEHELYGFFPLCHLNDCFQAIFIVVMALLLLQNATTFLLILFSVYPLNVMQQIEHIFLLFHFRFDVLVNGGGAVTLQFQRSPFHPMTRTVFVPWNQVNCIAKQTAIVCSHL